LFGVLEGGNWNYFVVALSNEGWRVKILSEIRDKGR
jgi:hypothetical protein